MREGGRGGGAGKRAKVRLAFRVVWKDQMFSESLVSSVPRTHTAKIKTWEIISFLLPLMSQGSNSESSDACAPQWQVEATVFNQSYMIQIFKKDDFLCCNL